MKKKIVYFLSSDHNYGAPRSLMELVAYLKEYENVEPIVVTCTSGRVNEFCNQMQIENHVIRYKEFMIVGGSNLFRKIVKRILLPFYWFQYRNTNKKAIKKLEKTIDFNNIDIIHTNINRVNIGAYFAKKYNIPHVWHIREFGREDYNCISLERKYIEKMNNSNSNFIAISNVVKDSWVQKGIEESKIKVIYNGIDNKKIKSKTEYECNDTYKVIFAGLISETKGQIQLIEALAKLPIEDRKKFKVDIYGGGREKYIDYVKGKVKKYELEKIVNFKGYSKDLYSIYNQYDIGVVCSKSEGFGRVTAEYMASGLCIIASDKGANVELVDNGENGLLYRYGDIDSLVEVLSKIAKGKVDINLMQKKSYQKAIDLYTMKVCAERVNKLYDEVEAKK